MSADARSTPSSSPPPVPASSRPTAAPSPEPAGEAGPTWCSWCGGALAEDDHARCVARLSLVDPPRYCPRCARRMVVQVDPVGWTARCSRHGETTSAPGARR